MGREVGAYDVLHHGPASDTVVWEMDNIVALGEGVLMNKGPEIRAFKVDMRRNVGIFVEETSSDGRRLCIAEPLVMKEHEMYANDPQPTVSLTPTAAQQLIDDLWDCGLRPSEGSGSAGQLAATERHLKDMRTIVFEFEKGVE